MKKKEKGVMVETDGKRYKRRFRFGLPLTYWEEVKDEKYK